MAWQLIKVQDDGRGLAINKLFGKALNDGLYEEGQRPDDIEIANLIFASGFSTADEVTDVSGRGVGMDAVKQFLLKDGGGIEICLEDDCDKADFRAFSTKISLPEKILPKRLIGKNKKYYQVIGIFKICFTAF